MNTWLSLLGGLALWAAHFLASYALASLADISPYEHQAPLTWLLAGLTLACVLAAVALGVRAWRATGRPGLGGAFVQRLSALASLLSAIAILWQSAPFLWRY
ncbi:hypothetical protein DMC25_00640 [Caulobacter sp. D4A]|uniref:hypothetical protein n=1 Tax=unclassified Caulobacter TaxID=2648921 RepID=UPI000D73F0C9|nr:MULTISPECIES: hypothetical protein [unclassified Caulobacter]PXA94760.1 hypothetical protein DMC18_05605 [Caulobacter sp. D5]PXA95473.1 hypothetical protein DMC25_00640 [Caulobacter sp. D4A]